MSITGARYIVEFLHSQGVRTMAGIPGGSILPLYDAIARQGKIRHVLARHEQGAAFMAQGMARLTGRPGVCLATSGPGSTNLVTAIADARRDSVPLVCLTGQVPVPQLGTEAFQEVDIVALTKSITKSSRMVRDARELPQALTEAFGLAAGGRPGPVLLDIPRDVQAQAMDQAGLLPIEPLDAPTPPGPKNWDVSRAAAMINASQRPVLLLGGGAGRGLAPDLARVLAEKAGLPVTMTLMGLGALPASHCLNLGMHGMHGHVPANKALRDCDLLIAVGSRFDDRATGRAESFCPKARIIHINLDPGEIGRVLRADVGMVSDAALALAAILPLVAHRERREWLGRIERFKARPGLSGNSQDRCQAREVIAMAAGKLPQDAVVVTDVGQHQMFVAQDFPFARPGRWLTSGGLGVMGFGLPAAIGAALAEPEAQVICFSGDGSLKMNIQELATLADTGANVKVVVLDNQGLGLVAQQQRLFFAGRKSASRFARSTDFAAVAEAFGVPGVDLQAACDPRAALGQALESRGPALIHARVDKEALVFPFVPPGAANSEMLHAGPENDAQPEPRTASMS